MPLKDGFAPTVSLKNANDLYNNWQMDSIDMFIKFADEGIRAKYMHYADGGLNLHIN